MKPLRPSYLYPLSVDEIFDDSKPFFVLDARDSPQPATLCEWAAWMAAHGDIEDAIAGSIVRTSFTGIPHGHRELQPLLFETRRIDGLCEQFVERHATKAAAMAAHKRICGEIRAKEGGHERAAGQKAVRSYGGVPRPRRKGP